jgi:hypothetical protein
VVSVSCVSNVTTPLTYPEYVARFSSLQPYSMHHTELNCVCVFRAKCIKLTHDREGLCLVVRISETLERILPEFGTDII